MTSWTLTIPSVTPSLNQVRKLHWAARKREETKLGWEVVSALNQIPAIPRAKGKRRLTICRHGRKAMDQDNLAGGCKALIDILKAKGLLIDDNPDMAELIFTQAVTRKGPLCTVVTLEDITDQVTEVTACA
jgi:Holliday junction resolvase RusA-like endonuclease